MPVDALTLRIKALIAFRAIFITLLLGSAFLFKVVYFYAHPKAISYFIITLYILTIVYSLLLYRVKRLFAFAYMQLVLDVVSEITLIYITGGIESWFSFTLILTVLSSSIVLNNKAGFVIASLSSILYGLLLDLQFYAQLPGRYEMFTLQKEFIYNIFIHILSFYITAYLSGNLSSRLEKTVKKLEEKDSHLKDLEFFNINVIESLPSGLFTTDMEGHVLVFNKAAEKISGVSKAAVIGGTISPVFPFLKFPFREGRIEDRFISAGGEEKIIGLHISTLKDLLGNDTGVIGIFQDLTQLKHLEAEIKQKEKWAAIGELATNIAHEIRNPLASMKGSIEMLKEDRIPQKHKEKLMEIALKEMERLNHIITDFLTYSSPRPLEIRRTDVNMLLEETLALLSHTENNRGNIEIRRVLESPLFVECDPQKLRQVFWNLGLNAVEAMQNGGVLTVSSKTEGDMVKISFTDTGPGLAPEAREKIFYPFYTTKDGGTGLGLSIAYRMIEEHNGSLHVKSTPGIMTTFEIILTGNYGNT